MLTIREPIALKTQRPVQSIRQDLAERIQANYGLMRLPIRKEELLHITSEPPEVYFAEGDTIQIFSNVKHENQQEIRLDVINNLMNRIMVSQTDNFTYQDTVYISSVLRKLGIRDEKTFMKQVFALQNEQKETHQLLKNYEEHQEILQIIFQQQREQQKAEGKQPEVLAPSEQRYYIHDEIFKRLETGKIYQDLRNFSKGLRHETQQIFRHEISIGEQAALIQNFHLHALKQKIMQLDAPLLYFHQNQYEFLQEDLENIHQTLEEQISAAILLNLTDQTYHLRREQIEQNQHHWYAIAGALFQTAENTWKRYEANLIENKRISNQMLQNLEAVHEVKRQEGDVIQNIAQEFCTLNQEWKKNAERRQTILQQYNRQETNQQENNQYGGSYRLTQEELHLHFLQQAEEEEEKEKTEEITVEQLQKQLELFSQKNYETYQKLTEIEQQRPRLKERKVERRKAQRDALRALENPGEVLMEFLTAEVQDPVQETQKQVESQIYELFSEETKEIYRQFLQQNHSRETTFLQHVMEQPVESEIRQEVVYAIERVQQQEVKQRIEQRAEQFTKIEQPTVVQTINQEIRQYMTSLQELQQMPVYQQWTQPTELYWQKEVEMETQILEQMGEEHQKLTIQREQILQKAEAEGVGRTVEAVEKHIISYPELLIETEEIHPAVEEKMILHQQRKQMTELRQTIEKQIQKQQMEKITEQTAMQRELRFHQVDFVHKVEEQFITEEFLENIRTQQQRTRTETHTEETTLHQNQINQTVVQDTVNRMQVNQMENIDELVQQTVRRQMNHISDQVYGKIEKKLATERKRRGF